MTKKKGVCGEDPQRWEKANGKEERRTQKGKRGALIGRPTWRTVFNRKSANREVA
jgi:hypothetical protein